MQSLPRGNLTIALDASYTTQLDLGSASANLALSRIIRLTNGTGAAQSDLIWHDRRTLTASNTEDLDLAGSLVDAFGNTLTFARVKFVIVYAAEANTNNVEVSVAAANGWSTWAAAASDTVVVRPGGFFVLGASDATSYAVTAGTGDLLTITNSAAGTSVEYDIVFVGASA